MLYRLKCKATKRVCTLNASHKDDHQVVWKKGKDRNVYVRRSIRMAQLMMKCWRTNTDGPACATKI